MNFGKRIPITSINQPNLDSANSKLQMRILFTINIIQIKKTVCSSNKKTKKKKNEKELQ